MEKTEKHSSIPIFIVINFVFAGICFLGVMAIGAVLTYGIFLSNDPHDEVITGVIGCTIIGLPFLIGFFVYLLAGIGMIKQKAWGYYCHIAGGILSLFNCIGIIYSIFVFICSFQPSFKDHFLKDNPVTEKTSVKPDQMKQYW